MTNVEGGRSRRSETERAFVSDNEDFAKQQLSFALNLYRRALEDDAPDANVVVAPFSVCRCLNALSLGSAGQTKAEIDAALGRDEWSDERWSETFLAADRGVNETREATLTGALWLAPDLKLDKTFVERCEKMSQTKATTLDFKAPTALKTANDWFEKNTAGKIKNLLSEFDPETRLLIADATTFKVQWREKFKERSTRTRSFTNAQGNAIFVSMMAQTGRFRYHEAYGFQYLEAEYENGRFALSIVLPRDYRLFAEVERALTPAFLLECRDRAMNVELEFRLPRFKVERSCDLSETLRKAGVVSAFKDSADFTRTTVDGEKLKVGQVKQAAFLEVDENGTEAGAATAVEIKGLLAAPPPPARLQFYADRPFFYFLRDNATGVVLFAGRLVTPELRLRYSG